MKFDAEPDTGYCLREQGQLLFVFKGNDMNLELNEQEHQYLLQVLLERPAKEALPMILKLTNQRLVASSDGPPSPVGLRIAGADER
jgi:hypothetical protein